MTTYIKNINGLNEYLGYETENAYQGEEIGYGEKAIIFKDVTDDCIDFEDFAINAEIGQAFNFEGQMICKVKNSHGDAENVYETETGEIKSF